MLLYTLQTPVIERVRGGVVRPSPTIWVYYKRLSLIVPGVASASLRSWIALQRRRYGPSGRPSDFTSVSVSIISVSISISFF